MKELEKEIIEFHSKQAHIADLQVKLSEMEEKIIAKYCPFKKGDKVVFTEWWRGNGKDYFGVVKNIQFKGINPDAIDNRWILWIVPTTKDFKNLKGGYNSSYKHLGINRNDKIRIANA